MLVAIIHIDDVNTTLELHREEVRETDDGKHIFVRVKRTTPSSSSPTASAGDTEEVCKYKKGDWAACDMMTMVENICN